MKIIQIAVTPETKRDFDMLYALGDDGSIWYLVSPSRQVRDPEDWVRVPIILPSDGDQNGK
jgi:hypothetical protein